MRFRQIPYLAMAMIGSTLFIAGCGQSSVLSPQVVPTSSPVTPSSPVLPAESAFSATSVVRPAAAASATSLQLPLPGNSSYAGHATFPVPSVAPNLILTLTYSNSAPSGVVPFSSARKTPATVSNAVRKTAASTRLQPLQENSTDTVYGCFAANYLVTLNGAPQFRFVLPANFAPAGVDYYLALLQNGAWASNYGGPGSVVSSSTATTVTVAGRFPFTIPADGTICAALYARYTTAAPQTPATPAPGLALTVTAAPVAVNAAGGLALLTGTVETLSVASADAPVTATTTCPNSVATLSGSPGSSITLTAIGVGTCSVTLTNAAGHTTTIPIVISSSATALSVTAAPAAIVGGAVTVTVGTPETFSVASADAPATATTTCGTGSIATISGSPGATITLTAAHAGTCSLTLSNAAGKTATISIVVPTATALSVTAAPTAIIAGGVTLSVGAIDTLTVASADAPATATTTCGTGSVATLTGSPGATFTLTGTAVGTCALTLTDTAGKTSTIAVTVAAGSSSTPTPAPGSTATPAPGSTATPAPGSTATPSPAPGVAAGGVYIADQAGFITKYSPSGTSLLTFQTSSNDPLGVAIDATGNIYTANATGNTLLKYTAAGTASGTITTANGPTYPAIAPNGNIWTAIETGADGPHGSLEAYTPGGTRVATVTAGMYGPIAIAIDQSGKVYAANNGGNNVTTYTSSGTQTTPTFNVSTPYSVAVAPSGKVFITNGQSLFVFNADGTTSSTPSIPGAFVFVAIDNAGNIYLLNKVTSFSPPFTSVCTESMYGASGVQIGSSFLVSASCDGIAVH